MKGENEMLCDQPGEGSLNPFCDLPPRYWDSVPSDAIRLGLPVAEAERNLAAWYDIWEGTQKFCRLGYWLIGVVPSGREG